MTRKSKTADRSLSETEAAKQHAAALLAALTPQQLMALAQQVQAAAATEPKPEPVKLPFDVPIRKCRKVTPITWVCDLVGASKKGAANQYRPLSTVTGEPIGPNRYNEAGVSPQYVRLEHAELYAWPDNVKRVRVTIEPLTE